MRGHKRANLEILLIYACCFEELKRCPVIETDAAPGQSGAVFVGFGEVQPPMLLLHGKLGRHPKLERLQFRLVFRYQWTANLDDECCITEADAVAGWGRLLDSPVVEQCLLGSSLRSQSSPLRSRPISGLGLCAPNWSRANQRPIVTTSIPSSERRRYRP